MMTTGLSSAKLGHLLSRAVSLMPAHNCYVEVGTFTGYTLLAAAIRNPHKQCLGIDSFRPDFYAGKVESVKRRIELNLGHFSVLNARVINADFKDVVKFDHPIGVHLIDGEHTAQAVLGGLEWAEEHLADHALIFLDDISFGDVYEGVEAWLSSPVNRKSYREIFKMHIGYAEGEHHWNPVFWNGLSILEFHREAQ